ncbi:hypothetical protein AN1V17_31250 [Vallitalea sediminicola]
MLIELSGTISIQNLNKIKLSSIWLNPILILAFNRYLIISISTAIILDVNVTNSTFMNIILRISIAITPFGILIS